MIENSYNDYLREVILELFPRKETLFFMTRKKELIQKLSSKGMDMENIEWCDDALIIFNSSVPVGATPEYLAGY